MISELASPWFAYVLNHLWQSTLFAAAAWLLTLLLSRYGARTRYWLWLTASVKFLIPFSLLVSAGSYFDLTHASTAADPGSTSAALVAMEQVFSAPGLATPTPSPARPATPFLPLFLVATWACGFAIVMFNWWRQWRRIRTAVRTAAPLALETGIKTLSSATLLEPGVFGILRPVLLLPAGITERLTPHQLKAILAHELCHVRCRDNLGASLQMLAEAIFWFHPLVWWIGKRMVDERERACDEEVLRLGSDPQVYAESILKVCTLYLESPLACVAGVTGSNLRRRIRGIMTNQVVQKLDTGKKLLLTVVGIAAIAGPIGFGILNAPQIRAQSAAPMSFDVASIKLGNLKDRRDTRTTPTGIEYYTVNVRKLVSEAYGVKPMQISSPDGHTMDQINQEYYNITAKIDHAVSREQINLMIQTLLAERFKLVLHRETKVESVYKLVVGASGPKLQESTGEGESDCLIGAKGGATCRNMTMAAFSNFLGGHLSRVVLDQTELKKRYDFTLTLDGTAGTDQLRETVNSGGDIGALKRSMSDWTGTSIFTDIQKQLGLKLEAEKGPVDNLVIDHVEKPTEN